MKTNNSNGALTAQVNLGNHQKSGFDLSNNVLGTGKIGRIIPTRALHVMPGDTIKADSKVAVQFEPLAVPILANMDVRQEHFYVPYNIVWKNWDKFISGGEKMDYQGAVPSVSKRDIVSLVVDYLSPLFRYSISLDIDGGNEDHYLNITDFQQTLDNLQVTLDNEGVTYQIKDLLKPQYKVLEMLREYAKENNMNRPLGFYYNFGTRGFDLQEFEDFVIEKGWFEKLRTSKYYNDYILAIKSIVRRAGDVGGDYNNAPILSDFGYDLITMMYDYYKSFFGYGSNIDYLGMGCVSFSEFLVSVIEKFHLIYAESDFDRYAGTGVVIDGYFPILEPSIFSDMPLSALHLRANYNIWYNNYRDILLESEAMEPQDIDYVEDEELFVLLVPRQRCWEKDAFTTALDNPGTGNVAVPLLDNPSNILRFHELSEHAVINDTTEQVEFYDQLKANDMTVTEYSLAGQKFKVPTGLLSGQNPSVGTYKEQTGFSLHALDAAQRAQKWLQKALYFGNRISDFYYMRFGVRFLDARLRLPELLTSSRELVKLDVVMNNTNITTEANGQVYQSVAGDRAAYASAYDNGNSFDRFCEEHGVIMSYLTIMPQATYAYGISRDYSRLDQFDFAFGEFATLGMDAVYDTEITACSLSKKYLFSSSVDGVTQEDIGNVFGYQGRYYDYKAKHSEEHGELLDTQDMYTFARKFQMLERDGRPKLNYEFVHCFPDLDMFVVNSPLADYFRYDIRHSTAAERELPSQSIYI